MNFTQDAVVLNNESVLGVFVAGTIISKKTPFVKILNTTSNTVAVNAHLIKTVNLDSYHIYNVKENKLENRESKLLSQLDIEVPVFVKDDITNLCKKYSDIFGLKSDKLSTNNFYKQKLNLVDHMPVYIKNYRTPMTQKQDINRQVHKMLQDGIIEPSTSEYNSPVLLVPKSPPTETKSGV